MENKRSYIGDGVYVTYDGYHIKLKCDCMSEPNTIGMEPMVIQNLMRFIETCFDVSIKVEKNKEVKSED